MPKHQQLALNFQGKPIRLLPVPTPRLVAQDVADALGITWNGALRLQHQVGVPAKAMTFAQVTPWVFRKDRKDTSRMSVVRVHGLLQALKHPSTPLARGPLASDLLRWLEAVLPRPELPVVVQEPVAAPAPLQVNTLTSREIVVLNETDHNLSTTSLVIAEGLGVDHASIIKLIRRHTYELEKFGLLDWQSKSTSGRPTEYVVLSERQATGLMLYTSNTPSAAEFKFRLIDTFYRMKQQLQTTQLATRPTGLVTAPDPKQGLTGWALHQARINDMNIKGQQMLADEMKLLRQEHEDLEARVAALAALLEGGGEEGR